MYAADHAPDACTRNIESVISNADLIQSTVRAFVTMCSRPDKSLIGVYTHDAIHATQKESAPINILTDKWDNIVTSLYRVYVAQQIMYDVAVPLSAPVNTTERVSVMNGITNVNLIVAVDTTNNGSIDVPITWLYRNAVRDLFPNILSKTIAARTAQRVTAYEHTRPTIACDYRGYMPMKAAPLSAIWGIHPTITGMGKDVDTSMFAMSDFSDWLTDCSAGSSFVNDLLDDLTNKTFPHKVSCVHIPHRDCKDKGNVGPLYYVGATLPGLVTSIIEIDHIFDMFESDITLSDFRFKFTQYLHDPKVANQFEQLSDDEFNKHRLVLEFKKVLRNRIPYPAGSLYAIQQAATVYKPLLYKFRDRRSHPYSIATTCMADGDACRRYGDFLSAPYVGIYVPLVTFAPSDDNKIFIPFTVINTHHTTVAFPKWTRRNQQDDINLSSDILPSITCIEVSAYPELHIYNLSELIGTKSHVDSRLYDRMTDNIVVNHTTSKIIGVYPTTQPTESPSSRNNLCTFFAIHGDRFNRAYYRYIFFKSISPYPPYTGLNIPQIFKFLTQTFAICMSTETIDAYATPVLKIDVQQNYTRILQYIKEHNPFLFSVGTPAQNYITTTSGNHTVILVAIHVTGGGTPSTSSLTDLHSSDYIIPDNITSIFIISPYEIRLS